MWTHRTRLSWSGSSALNHPELSVAPPGGLGQQLDEAAAAIASCKSKSKSQDSKLLMGVMLLKRAGP